MSVTSGVLSRPPRPTTCTGSPARCRASITASNCERLRHSTAAETPVGRPCPSSHRRAIQPARWAASVSVVSSRAAHTRPGPASARGASTCTSTLDLARSGPEVMLAARRMALSLRQLVDRGSTCASPELSANSRAKRVNVVALAPRQP